MTEEKVAQGKPPQPVGQQTERTNDLWAPPQAPLATMPLSEKEQRLSGLGGWLIFLGVTLGLKVFYRLYDMIYFFLPRILSGVEGEMNAGGTVPYIPHLGALFWNKAFINTLLLCGWVFVIVLFFLRKKSFKTWFISMALLYPLTVVLDGTVVMNVLPNTRLQAVYEREIIMALFYAGIWVSYVYTSKRVRLTFVH